MARDHNKIELKSYKNINTKTAVRQKSVYGIKLREKRVATLYENEYKKVCNVYRYLTSAA